MVWEPCGGRDKEGECVVGGEVIEGDHDQVGSQSLMCCWPLYHVISILGVLKAAHHDMAAPTGINRPREHVTHIHQSMAPQKIAKSVNPTVHIESCSSAAPRHT